MPIKLMVVKTNGSHLYYYTAAEGISDAAPKLGKDVEHSRTFVLYSMCILLWGMSWFNMKGLKY